MKFLSVRPLPNSSNRVRHACAIVAFAAAVSWSATSHADPDDFQAMPGLWKVETRSSAHARKSTVKWHCVYEEADPWIAFADVTIAGATCTRTDELRTSTMLTWTLTCRSHKPASLHGRVEFDSATHYVATLSDGSHELVHVEGMRRAACTDPND